MDVVYIGFHKKWIGNKEHLFFHFHFQCQSGFTFCSPSFQWNVWKGNSFRDNHRWTNRMCFSFRLCLPLSVSSSHDKVRNRIKIHWNKAKKRKKKENERNNRYTYLYFIYGVWVKTRVRDFYSITLHTRHRCLLNWLCDGYFYIESVIFDDVSCAIIVVI